MNKILSIEEIRKRLKESNIQQVARDSGLHASALYKIKDGLRKPRYETAIKLTKVLTK